VAADGQPIRFGVTIHSLEERADGARVEFDDVSSATYDLVIGADGVHSELRRRVFGGPMARLAGRVAARRACWPSST
jgi:2-polyprenyl-6-methoxyphenol hydroxylase-like FAD-dependent oxidoreductase